MKKHSRKSIGQSVGHYVTTTVVTYAMLGANAAPLLSLTDSEGTVPAEPSTNPAIAPEPPASVDPIAPPEAISVPSTSATLLQESALPAAAPPAVVPDASAPPPTVHPSPPAITPLLSQPIVQPIAAPTPSQTAQPPAPPTSTQSTAWPPASAPASGSQPTATPRRTVEQQLTAMVERDKVAREQLFRENLIASVLQYLEVGQFDLARQVAQHPALPPVVQLELLDKIAKQEAYQAKQTEKVATDLAKPDKTSDLAKDLAKIPPSTLPSPELNYSTVPGNALPGGRNLPGFSGAVLSDRCIDQNLASSQLTSDLEPTVRGVSQPQAVSRNVSSTGTNTGTNTGNPANANPSHYNPAAQLSRLQARAASPTASQRLPNLTGYSVTSQTPSIGATNSATNGQTRSLRPVPSIDRPTQAAQPGSNQPSVPKPDDLTLDRMVGSALAMPLTQVENALPEGVPTAIQSVLGWWNPQTHSRFSLGPDGTMSPSLTPGQGLVKPLTPLVLTAALPIKLLQQQLAPSPQLPTAKTPAAKVTVSAKPSTAQPNAAQPKAAQPVATINCSVAKPGDFVLRQMDNTTGSWDWGRFQFPLPVPTAITSAFGWRIHPITGDRRFHMGIDFGAPTGTPVLAALSGRVVVADEMGGYGLSVVIETEGGSERNLYAHLSGIAVQPGTQVQQGTVIGWVGSTGNSTGPHLHFEAHQLTNEGWVAIDPLAAAVVASAVGNQP